ncbi:MAG TPA: response regulator [Telmatospirillum sp.]|nr:response regulator [Telmatospirillum sp.]
MDGQPHILVVDDDTRLRQLLNKYLTENGYLVSTAADAAQARGQLDAMTFDLIVLDVMMPGESGLALTKSLRADNPVPILLLTAMGETTDRINGLEMGADDYLTKPFEPRELLLRINSILRRSARDAPDEPRQCLFGHFIFDLARNELLSSGEAVHLTSAEAALLGVLAGSPGETLSREDLAAKTGNSGNLRTVDVQITRLRKKIEEDPRLPRYLQTVRGRGYVLWTD